MKYIYGTLIRGSIPTNLSRSELSKMKKEIRNSIIRHFDEFSVEKVVCDKLSDLCGKLQENNGIDLFEVFVKTEKKPNTSTINVYVKNNIITFKPYKSGPICDHYPACESFWCFPM